MFEGARVPARQAAVAASPRHAAAAPRADRRPAPSLQARLLGYQRTLGNRAVQRLVQTGLRHPGKAPASRAGPAAEAPRPADRAEAGAAPSALAPAAATPHAPPLARPSPDAARVQPAWYNVDIPFTDYQFDPSLEGLGTAAGIVRDAAVSGFEWVVDRIKSLVAAGIDWLREKWEAIQQLAASAFESLKSAFKGIVGFAKNPLGFLADALLGLDAESIRKAWSRFSGLISSAADGFKTLADKLFGQVSGLWGRIDGYAKGLLERVAGLTDGFVFKRLPDALQRVALRVVDTLKALWKGIADGWNAIYRRLKGWIDAALDAVLAFVRKVLSFAIDTVIAGIVQFARLVLFLKDLFANPQKYVEILAKRGAEAFNGVEAFFDGVVAQHFGSAKAAPGSGAVRIDRKPQPATGTETKSSASWGEVGDGIARTMRRKWEEFKSNPMAVLTTLLLDMVLPVIGNVKDVIHLFGEIRKIVTGPLGAGSLEELWTSLLKILDIPILIYHTVVSILMRTLMLPLIVATFVPHPLVKGIAAAVGYALLGAFIQAETMNLAHKLVLLKTGATTQAEKDEAYNRIADSLIAFAMAALFVLLMLLLHFLVNLMKGVYNFVRSKVFRIEPKPVEAKGSTPAEGQSKAGEARDVPERVDGERVTAETTTPDGHRVKVTENGRIFVCTTCQEIQIRYAEELARNTPEMERIRADLEKVREMPNGDAKAEAAQRIKERLDEVRQQARAAEPIDVKMSSLDAELVKARGAIETAKEGFRGEGTRELRASDPAARKDLARLEAEVDALGREWAQLSDEAKSLKQQAKEVADDPQLSELAGKEIDSLRDRIDNARTKAEEVKHDVDERIRANEEARRLALERTRAAEAKADEAVRKANDTCDQNDGTARPDASIGDGTTEAAIRHEIETGRPHRSSEGHHQKAAEDSRGLDKALDDMQRARPDVKDPDLLRRMAEATARATDRIAKMRAALEAWNRRATTHPEVWNPDGTSKVTPNWPSPRPPAPAPADATPP